MNDIHEINDQIDNRDVGIWKNKIPTTPYFEMDSVCPPMIVTNKDLQTKWLDK